MGLWIEGMIPIEEGEVMAKQDRLHMWFGPDEDREGQYVLHDDKGLSKLADAVKLWKLLGSPKANELEHLVHEVIRNDERDPAELGCYSMTAKEIEQILSYIDGLDEALLAITDKEYYVLPEYLEFVQSKPHLHVLDSKQRTDGTWEHRLYSPLVRARNVAKFLRFGLRMIREYRCYVYCD
jgi:hypothetical protein